jgi:hypothetical protein
VEAFEQGKLETALPELCGLCSNNGSWVSIYQPFRKVFGLPVFFDLLALGAQRQDSGPARVDPVSSGASL